MSDLPHTIGGTIRELNDTNATIVLENNETINIPKTLIPETASVGSGVHLAIFSDTDVKTEHERLAKAVLKELLRGE
ncbi:MAG: hypothetical protein O2877_00935 [bacterium]|nr:hypothetical protein [bacterium]